MLCSSQALHCVELFAGVKSVCAGFRRGVDGHKRLRRDEKLCANLTVVLSHTCDGWLWTNLSSIFQAMGLACGQLRNQ